MSLDEKFRLLDEELSKSRQLIIETRAAIARSRIEINRFLGEKRHLRLVSS